MEEPTPHPEGTPEEGSVRDRRCGRCQVTFAGEEKPWMVVNTGVDTRAL
jgi:hypothetical protein